MFVAEFAGSLYGQRQDPRRRKVPYNVLAQDVLTYSRALVATNPQLLISTFDPQLRGEVKLLETAANRRLFEIRWQNELEELAMDAIFCMAAAKIGVEEVNGKLLSYVDVIGMDDLILDMAANKFSEMAFCGHRFRKPLEDVLSNPKYDPVALNTLHPSQRSNKNERGDLKVSTITNADTNMDAEPQDMIDLCELFIPKQRRLITATFENGELGLKPLCQEQYEGPPDGPYEFCGLTKLPGNLIPLSPVAQLFDLHDAINHITQKIIRDAENHKIVNIAQKGTGDDVQKIMNEINGGVAFVDNPNILNKLELRGVNKADVAVLMQLMEMQNKQAGNVDVMSGLQSDASTLGQENLLVGNSSKLIQAMQDKMQNFITRIGRAVSWHVWHEAKREQVAVAHKVGALDTVQQLIPQGEFGDYDFSLNVYSMADTTPKQRLAQLDDYMTRTVIPMAPVMAAQGQMVDMRRLTALRAKYTNTPELEEIIVDTPPPDPMQGAGMEQEAPQNPGQGLKQGPSKPPSTERHYVRHSKGGAQAGRKAAMASMLAGAEK